MITWKPCHNGGCVQTGTDDYGNVWVRNSSGFSAVDFTQAEWDEHLDGIRREERQRISAVMSRDKIKWLIHTLDLIDKLAKSRGMDTSTEAQDDLRKLADLLDGDGDG